MIRIVRRTFKLFLEKRLLSRWLVLTMDLLIVLCASISSYAITNGVYEQFNISTYPNLIQFVGLAVFFNAIFFLIFKTYKGIVRYSTIRELQRIFVAILLAELSVFWSIYLVIGSSIGVSFAYTSTHIIMMMMGLFCFRVLVVYAYHQLIKNFGSNPPVPVFIWGANEENIVLAQRFNAGQERFEIKGFLTKSTKPRFKHLTNLPIWIVETTDDLIKYKITDVLFIDRGELKEQLPFIEKLMALDRRIYVSQPLDNICNMAQLSEAMNRIRPIEIEDLLGRPQIEINMDNISKNIKDKVILVTGAAGSIGSEIVNQLADFDPKLVVCFDQAETPLNDLNINIASRHSRLNFVSQIGDIRNKNTLARVFEKYEPQIVFHAAAYKHVPMMEKDPSEGVITNVLGTKNLVDISIANNIEMFVMVSTDKAVNPTNIMGATKRIAEIYVQSSAIDKTRNKSNIKFVTTRFGNVLGSNGSVIPMFKKQIQKGGPLTVTHPDITRYFMTIPEACRLVLEASTLGETGQIFVFDMGKPVKILDLATKMIRLAGLTPERDIDIEFTGLRPGEKLYEELLNSSEICIPTPNEKVMVANVREYSYSEILFPIEQIIRYAQDDDKYKMVALIKNLVPEYISQNSEFEALDIKTSYKLSIG